MNFDDSTSRYLCYIGELTALERFLECKSCRLLDVEHILPNRKSFDFRIDIDGTPHLIEIYSIFLDKDRLGTQIEFEDFFERRCAGKLYNKVDWTQPGSTNFALPPIVWAEERSLSKYLPFLQDFSPLKRIVLPPMFITSLVDTRNDDVVFLYVDVKQYLEWLSRKEAEYTE